VGKLDPYRRMETEKGERKYSIGGSRGARGSPVRDYVNVKGSKTGTTKKPEMSIRWAVCRPTRS